MCSGILAAVAAEADLACDRCATELEADCFRKSGGVRCTICRACEEITCKACGLTKTTMHFDEKSVHHFHRAGQNVLCCDCHAQGRTYRDIAVYTCIWGDGVMGCLRDLGHMLFQRDSLLKFKLDGQRALLCVTCEERANAKDVRLMKLWRQSVRRKCRCGPTHMENCPLRPHPGHDTLTRAHYNWLRLRNKIPMHQAGLEPPRSLRLSGAAA